MRNNNQSVQSISRAALILGALSNDLKRVSEIARETDLSQSTVHRLLKSLEETGLVTQDPGSHQYFLGHLLVKLASNPVTAHQTLIYCAQEKMRYLRELTGETVMLHIKLGARRVCLEEMVGTQDISYTVKPAIDSMLLAGAMGRVLLAQLPADQMRIILEHTELIPLTPHTVTDKAALLKEVEKIKQTGFAASHSEAVIGVSVISVPVKDYFEPVALSIIIPEHRLTPHLEEYSVELKKKSAEISQDFFRLSQRQVPGKEK